MMTDDERSDGNYILERRGQDMAFVARVEMRTRDRKRREMKELKSLQVKHTEGNSHKEVTQAQ